MRKQYLLLLLFIGLISLSSNCKADWEQTNGPYGAVISYIVANDSNIFIMTSDYLLYKSNNSNANWIVTSNYFTDKIVNDFFLQDTILFAFISNNVVFSSNYGIEWDTLSIGISGITIRDISFQENYIIAATNNGIYKTNNLGASWLNVTNNLPILNVIEITSDTIHIIVKTSYPGSAFNYVFKSIDGGTSWTYLLEDTYIRNLVISDSLLLSIGTNNSFLLRWNLNTQTYINTGPMHGAKTFLVFDSLLFIHKEYLGNIDAGIFSSPNLGQNWDIVHQTGYPELTGCNRLAIGSHKTTFYYSDGFNLYHKDFADLMSTWNKIELKGINKTRVVKLIEKNNCLYAAIYGAGLYKSIDKGNTWESLNNGLGNNRIKSFGISDSIMIIGGSNGTVSDMNPPYETHTLFKSFDSGNSWNKQILFPFAEHYVQSVYADNSLLIINGSGGYNYRSENNGLTWLPIAILGIDAGIITIREKTIVYSAFLNFSGNTSLYKTQNNGLTWTKITDSIQDIKSITKVGELFYVGTSNNGVYYSHDEFVTFKKINSGLNSLTINYLTNHNGYVFACTDSGVYYLQVAYDTVWTSKNTGLTSLATNSITMNDSGMYVSIFGGGIFYDSTKIGCIPTFSTEISPSTICYNDTLTLTINGAKDIFFNGNVQNNIQIVADQIKNYVLIARDTMGCIDTIGVSIMPNPLPTININSTDNSVCTLDSIKLSATGAQHYSWSDGIQNDTYFIPTTSKDYTVTGIDSIGCKDTASIFIEVNPLPTLQVSASSNVVCFGDSTTLTASGAQTITWSNNLQNGVSFKPNSSSTYIVKGTDNNGCSDSASVFIQVNNPSPTIQFDKNKTIQSSIEYPTYKWFLNGILIPLSNRQNIIITQNGDYQLQVLDSLGCIGLSNILKVRDFNSIDLGNQLLFDCFIYPNPTSGIINVHLTSKFPVTMSVYLIASDGRLIEEFCQNIPVSNIGENKFTFQMNPNLPDGYYTLKIETSDGFKCFKLSKY